METYKITSRQNPQVKAWVQIKNDKNSDIFLVEGAHLVEMAASAHALLAYISVDDDNPYGVEHYVINQSVAEKLSSFKTTPGIFGICRKHTNKFSDVRAILYLDELRDPGNLGTILRSALAFGFTSVIASPNSVDFYHDKVVASAQGAHFFLDLEVADQQVLVQLKRKGYHLVVTTLEQASHLENIKSYENVIVVIGNEAKGVSQNLLDIADTRLKIAMNQEIDSLNAGVAASIIMHHIYVNKNG